MATSTSRATITALVAAALVLAACASAATSESPTTAPVSAAPTTLPSSPVSTMPPSTVPPSTVPPSTVPPSTVPPTSLAATTTTAPPTTPAPTTTAFVPVYVFPFSGRTVSYGRTHHDYPAADVFGCTATVLAPTSGTVAEISLVDRWDPAVNDPATRGGLYVSMIGDDGVRYYVAHLASVAVAPGEVVAPGSPLGVMGQTGNARNSACHTHFGISWPCPSPEWKVRRGKIWPAAYLDAWKQGEQRSPATEVLDTEANEPTACADAAALMT